MVYLLGGIPTACPITSANLPCEVLDTVAREVNLEECSADGTADKTAADNWHQVNPPARRAVYNEMQLDGQSPLSTMCTSSMFLAPLFRGFKV